MISTVAPGEGLAADTVTVAVKVPDLAVPTTSVDSGGELGAGVLVEVTLGGGGAADDELAAGSDDGVDADGRPLVRGVDVDEGADLPVARSDAPLAPHAARHTASAVAPDLRRSTCATAQSLACDP